MPKSTGKKPVRKPVREKESMPVPVQTLPKGMPDNAEGSDTTHAEYDAERGEE